MEEMLTRSGRAASTVASKTRRGVAHPIARGLDAEDEDLVALPTTMIVCAKGDSIERTPDTGCPGGGTMMEINTVLGKPRIGAGGITVRPLYLVPLQEEEGEEDEEVSDIVQIGLYETNPDGLVSEDSVPLF